MKAAVKVDMAEVAAAIVTIAAAAAADAAETVAVAAAAAEAVIAAEIVARGATDRFLCTIYKSPVITIGLFF
jgi:hypothetical protein